MDFVLDILTRLMNLLGNAVFGALSFMPPTAALVVISAVMGWAMLVIWRYTSNQHAIKSARNQIAAHLLSTRLFKDNLAVTFRAQRMIVWHALRLLAYSIKPMLIMLVPFVLVMAQIGLRYEYRPASTGDVVRVTATLKPADSPEQLLSRLVGDGSKLALPPEITMDRHDPCRAEPIRTIDWRLTVARPGNYTLELGGEQDRVTIPLVVGQSQRQVGVEVSAVEQSGTIERADLDPALSRLSSLRGGHWLDRVLFSAEPSIPSGSIFEAVQIRYERRSTPIFGYDVHWLITLFVLSIVFALVFKPFMKVHI